MFVFECACDLGTHLLGIHLSFSLTEEYHLLGTLVTRRVQIKKLTIEVNGSSYMIMSISLLERDLINVLCLDKFVEIFFLF